MKKCSRCKDMLPAEAFSKSKNTKSGLRSSCKECKKVGRKTYYASHKEEARESYKEYYKDNLGYYTDCNKAYGTLYYEANKEGILDSHKSTEQLTRIRLLRLNTS
jgi:Iap family predicted aminopeptidase